MNLVESRSGIVNNMLFPLEPAEEAVKTDPFVVQIPVSNLALGFALCQIGKEIFRGDFLNGFSQSVEHQPQLELVMLNGFIAPAGHFQAGQVHIEIIHIGFLIPHGHIRAFFGYILPGQLVIKI